MNLLAGSMTDFFLFGFDAGYWLLIIPALLLVLIAHARFKITVA